MLKRTIEFNDLDGNKVVEDFYFNLSKAEIAELELSRKGGLSEYLKDIVKDEDGSEIIRIMREIIAMSVGVRSEDGRRFIKNNEVRDNFLQTDAYSELFMEMVTNADEASKFIAAIVPSDVSVQISGSGSTDVQLPNDDEIPAFVRENREPTSAELTGMSKEELQAAFRLRAERQKSQ